MPVVLNVIKAASQDPILRVAERMEAPMRKAFLDAVAAMQGTAVLTELARIIERQEAEHVVLALNLNANWARTIEGGGIEGTISVQSVIQETFTAGARAAIQAMPKAVSMPMAFNQMNPRAIEFLRDYDFNLVRNLSQESADVIRGVLTRAFEQGGNPRVTARELALEVRQSIGLTATQERAIANYRGALEGGNYQAALERALRDGRYDKSILAAIRNDTSLNQDRIDMLVQRYRERWMDYRAKAIARTETLRAANAGKMESIRQAIEQGLLDDSVRKRTHASDDDRTCEECSEIAADTKSDPIPLEEDFIPGYLYPPFHPHCRCTFSLVQAK